ncbi:MAG: hypothetical protein HYY17_16655 [Planctomycetes bacterium]|nr:hypothetical protein [Planctomycetota bacterium]
MTSVILLSALAGGGIVVRDGGEMHVASSGEIRLAGSLDVDGTLLVRGRLVVGGHLRVSSARFEEGSELALAGGRAHRLDVPPDLALWNVTWAGRLEGELRPVFGARGGRRPGFRDGNGGSPAAAPVAGGTGASGEAESRATSASTSSGITIVGRIGARAAGKGPSDRGPPIAS